jgi:hypothetical protein
MSDRGLDPVAEAAMRLEAAVERLAEIAARPRPPQPSAEGGVPRAAVAAIADKLDATVARLRAALGEEA